MPQKIKPVVPDLEEYHYLYLNAFYDLSSCRYLGSESVGPIPYTAIIMWCQYWELDSDESDLYMYIINKLDSIYMGHVYKKRDESINELKRSGRT